MSRAKHSPSVVPNTAAPARLLGAAIKVFAEHGYEGATLRMIAEEAKLFFQLITYHFGSKEALWIAAMSHLIDERISAIRATRLDPSRDLEPQLRQWLRTSVLFCIEEPHFFKLMIDIYVGKGNASHSLALAPKRAELRREFHDAFVHICKIGAVKDFSADEVELLVDSMAIAIIGMPYEIELTCGMHVSDPRYAEFHVELLLNLLVRGRGTGKSRLRRRSAS
jgi:AcrR family transcriptional regulator